mmetsp:Transcript_4310/g.10221  ORF Transcript_4310/g.10221 Transcript_4310/m.10221 type:complete len:238 (+) Transcript_4310:915-1628(+)
MAAQLPLVGLQKAQRLELCNCKLERRRNGCSQGRRQDNPHDHSAGGYKTADVRERVHFSIPRRGHRYDHKPGTVPVVPWQCGLNRCLSNADQKGGWQRKQHKHDENQRHGLIEEQLFDLKQRANRSVENPSGETLVCRLGQFSLEFADMIQTRYHKSCRQCFDSVRGDQASNFDRNRFLDPGRTMDSQKQQLQNEPFSKAVLEDPIITNRFVLFHVLVEGLQSGHEAVIVQEPRARD